MGLERTLQNSCPLLDREKEKRDASENMLLGNCLGEDTSEILLYFENAAAIPTTYGNLPERF